MSAAAPGEAATGPHETERALDALLGRLYLLHKKDIELTLGRMERLLAALGSPERRLPPIVHVAGTNGKGSTIAFLRAILEAGGQTAHVYTSPHLVRFHERIRLGAPGAGQLVDDETLYAALKRCEEVNGGAPITFFEFTTAAAFDIFARHAADFLLLEVGLGGRGDATNVVERPAACAITSISIDHPEFLGATVDRIAFEKAGVFKPGVPAVVAPQDGRALDVLRREARRKGAPLIEAQRDFFARAEQGRLIFEDERGLIDLPLPRLPGRHQIENAATAVALARLIAPELPAEAFERGLLQVEWPARLQNIVKGRLVELAPAGAEIWLDGGHNEDGGRAVAEAMADFGERAERPLVLVCGTLTTKDTGAFLRAFAGLAQEAIAVPVRADLYGKPAAEVAAAAKAAGVDAAACDSVADALRFLAAREWPTPPRILIAGSLYLAGEALALNGTPPR
ncbi:bifunctional folylpolyglutamate synthase/dihydrofolate synthase [Methylocella sp.]|uniref:bifunctional folylpolyglutamate synthase/dihydrofolate synthase n=1 Tax=Methylocella sp. TaxID=1978226 RepID=UPI0037830762